MPHGTPDWGLVGTKDITYGLDDLGEHAVRVGSPHLWDRRGDVVYATSFREGLGMFRYAVSGAGGAVNLVTGHSRQGAYSIRLRTGSTVLRAASISLTLPFQDPSAVGLEFSFGAEESGSMLSAECQWLDGVNRYVARVIYDFGLQQVRYFTAGSVWVVLAAGISRYNSDWPGHTMKMVFDMRSNDYVRFMLDELAWDMRGIPVQQTAIPWAPWWLFIIEHSYSLAFNYDAYVDNAIITQEEPR